MTDTLLDAGDTPETNSQNPASRSVAVNYEKLNHTKTTLNSW